MLDSFFIFPFVPFSINSGQACRRTVLIVLSMCAYRYDIPSTIDSAIDSIIDIPSEARTIVLSDMQMRTEHQFVVLQWRIGLFLKCYQQSGPLPLNFERRSKPSPSILSHFKQ